MNLLFGCKLTFILKCSDYIADALLHINLNFDASVVLEKNGGVDLPKLLVCHSIMADGEASSLL